MPACNVEVIKFLGKYLNTSVGPVSLNTDKVLTTVIDKQNVEGFVSIILMLSSKSGLQLSREQVPLVYQWLEHLPLYADQAVANQTFAKTFLQDINKWLQKNTYLVGQSLSIADVVAYYVLYPLLERLSILEKESLLYICRWSRHIQAQPREAKPFLSLPLPEQILPHQLKTVSLERPVLYYPQPFAYPSYPVVLYVR